MHWNYLINGRKGVSTPFCIQKSVHKSKANGKFNYGRVKTWLYIYACNKMPWINSIEKHGFELLNNDTVKKMTN